MHSFVILLNLLFKCICVCVCVCVCVRARAVWDMREVKNPILCNVNRLLYLSSVYKGTLLRAGDKEQRLLFYAGDRLRARALSVVWLSSYK